MDMEKLKGIQATLLEQDTKKFKKIAKMISKLSEGQARFALLLMASRQRGYLAMPDIQDNFIADLERAKKGRE